MQPDIELVKEWIIKADHDLAAAKLIYLHIPHLKETIGFHCQQAIEKYLKGYLVFPGKKYPFKHDLRLILDAIDEYEKVEDSLYKTAIELTPFAVDFKYPESRIEIKTFHFQEYIQFAELIREKYLSKMNLSDFKEEI